MKYLLLILTIMTSNYTSAQNGKASTVKKTFSRQTSVSITIDADPSIIWTLLTNASDYARWNSTIVFIEGEIARGETIRLKSTLDEKRVFKIKVKELIPDKTMTWGDSKGNRIFTLEPVAKNQVNFTMWEKMGGLMFPLYSKYIPPFDESFERFAADLKKEAELIQNSRN